MRWLGVASPYLLPAAGEPVLPLENIVEQVWATERKKSGKRPWQWLEVELDRCKHTFGHAPCTASGTKCQNSWDTCEDQPNFSAEPYWVRIAEACADIPRTFEFEDPGLAAFLPLLDKVDHSPTLPDPGETLGLRVQLSAQLQDAPHHDRGLDKYAGERDLVSVSTAYESHLWQVGVTPTGYTLNQDIAGESAFALRVNPFGETVVMNVCQSLDTPPGDPGADGGWVTSNVIPIDSSGSYLFACWFRRLSTATITGSSAYWGLHSNSASDILNLNGSSNTNPYFQADALASLMPSADKWYLFVGFVHENAYVDGVSKGISGVYDPVTGARIYNGGFEYKWPSDARLCGHRAYHYYNQTISGEAQQMWDPRVIPCKFDEAPYKIRQLLMLSPAYTPMARSTMLRKLRRRFPHYVGRRLRWYQGYITDAPRYADFRRREYVMERFEGPDAKGRARIVAKDPLKLLDDDRAQAPRKSKGTLLAALLAASSPATIDIVTTDTTEYDLRPGESVDYVRIGEEVIRYTGASVVSGNVRLSGLTYSAPSPYTTTRADHSAGDEVQRCRYFSGTIPAVVEELMTDWAGMDPAFIPLTDWELEADTWLAGDTVSRLVTEPEGVKSLIEEIIQQTLTWAFWFDEIDQEIKFRAVRPADYTDNIVELTDGRNLAADSVRMVDEPNRVINEVQALYGQIDPTESKDKIGNYRKGLVVVDADSQSANEIAQRRILRRYCRWQPAQNSAVVERWANRTLTSRGRNRMAVEFKIERKDEDLRTGDFADLTTLYLIDQFGEATETRVQVLRTAASDEEITYRAREDIFAGLLYGRWAPVELTGLSWLDATAEQRLRYMFWAGADGTFSNGDTGKIWL